MEHATKTALQITSTAFSEGQPIPQKYTCDGANVSPPISWKAGPTGTKSYALIVDDPDAPKAYFTHWVLFNIPSNVTQLEEGVPAGKTLANGARQGTNDFPAVGYGGPCPPSGTHRYHFSLYALDTDLNLQPGARKEQTLKAMEGHILGQGRLTGTYQRAKK